MRFKFIVTLFWLLTFSNAFSQQFKLEKVPSWVSSVDIPTESNVVKYNVSSGQYYKLVDYQSNLDENIAYYHQIVNVVSYSGITTASQLILSYDSLYQKIQIHHLFIWRNGKKIDRSSELSFERMNNEFNLQNGIYTGRISAYDNLDDIRKDDQIDFAYSIIGKNPIFGNGKYEMVPLGDVNPIDRLYMRIVYNKEKKYYYSTAHVNNNYRFKDTVSGNQRLLEIRADKVSALQLENHTPSWIVPYNYFTLSSFESYKEVNSWAQEVFALKTEPVLKDVFAEILTGTESTDEKINKIINYVQDDIRYMGIESGIGSIKPMTPDKVVKQRFGDCKDKSLLLLSLLKKIGIQEAYPVLVNTGMQNHLNTFLPSNEVFNHCIVRFDYNQQTFWIDPTFTQQGGDYRTTAIENYGKVLIIGLPSDSLHQMNSHLPELKTVYTEELRVNSFNEPAILDIKSERYGLEADRRRMVLEHNSTNDIAKGLTEQLQLLYPSVSKIGDLVIEDDEKKNIITATYKYEVDGFWKDEVSKESKTGTVRYFKFEPQTMYDYINVTSCVDRLYDISIDYPLDITYQITFHVPKEILVFDDYVKQENDVFFYSRTIEQFTSKSFRLTFQLKTKADSVNVLSYKKICEEMNKIAQSLPFIIYFNK